jgi:hypothetical protein
MIGQRGSKRASSTALPRDILLVRATHEKGENIDIRMDISLFGF